MLDSNLTILKYKAGNYGALSSALKKLKYDFLISNDLNLIEKSKTIILPGVGNFGSFSKYLNESKLRNIISEKINNGHKVIGICLGFQILFEKSEESPHEKGLSIFEGEIKKLSNQLVKTPNIGWHRLDFEINRYKFTNYFYFNHSFFLKTKNMLNILSSLKYGNNLIPAVYNKKNFYGFQFHPELSYHTGLKLLDAIIKR